MRVRGKRSGCAGKGTVTGDEVGMDDDCVWAGMISTSIRACKFLFAGLFRGKVLDRLEVAVVFLFLSGWLFCKWLGVAEVFLFFVGGLCCEWL